jgi:hypothetical protein
MSNPCDLLLAHSSRLAAYHSQKETMTWSAATLYVVAIAVLLASGREPFWHHAPAWKFLPFVALLALTAYVAFRFVSKQFKRRTESHLLVHACNNVVTKWLERPPKSEDCVSEDLGDRVFDPTGEYQLMPHALVVELKKIREKHNEIQKNRSWLDDDERLTILTMRAWTLAGCARLFLAWKPVAEFLARLGLG